MNDLRQEVAALRRRMRLQMLVTFGVLAIFASAAGGADAVARAFFVETDSWFVATKKSDTTTDRNRLVVTTLADKATVKVINANLLMDTTGESVGNILLAPQASPLPAGLAAGAIAYETSGKFKVYNGSVWAEPGGTQHALVRKSTNESIVSTTLQNDDELAFTIGANEVWVVDIWIQAFCPSATNDIKYTLAGPSGASFTTWSITSVALTNPPETDPALKTTNAGAVFTCALPANVLSSFQVHACVANGSTPGTVNLQWAQNQLGAGIQTIVSFGSTLEATRVQ